jgi:plasmid maintenance system killer protein
VEAVAQAGHACPRAKPGGPAYPARQSVRSAQGGRKGQHSIRINDQFRLCFTWKDGDAYDVEIVDYH